MRVSRVYQPLKLAANTVLGLTANAANHLTRVLRLSMHDKLQVFNETDGEFAASIKEINKQQVTIQIHEQLLVNAESPLKIHLGQAIARGEKMDWVIQKATELGVTEITPLITERCGVRLSEERWHKRLQHWQAVAISACEQCGRNQLPIMNEPRLLMDWIKQNPPALRATPFFKGGEQIRLVLDPLGEQRIKEKLIANIKQDVVLLIGPEGGLSESEINQAKQHDFTDVCLGPRVLRTETAGIAAIAAIQCLIGDF